MDTNKLRYFAATARLGGVTAASRALDVTPAAISKSVRSLERELGFALVTPSGRNLLVTDRGRIVAEQAERILADMERLADPDVSAAATRSLRLGTCAWFASYFFAELVRQLPTVEVSLFDAAPVQLEHALVDGVVDAVVMAGPMYRPEVAYERIGRMSMGVYARASLRATPRELPFVVHGATSASGDVAHGGDGWPLAPHARNVRYRVGSTASAFELCRRGLAAAYLPDFVAELHNRDANAAMQLKRIDFPRLGPSLRNQDVFIATRASDVDRQGAHLVGPLLAATCRAGATRGSGTR
ncbi:MAG: hypothetical protein JWO69_1027 [Thermoleophilia bacterium]|nr:hypothetical protein [Thermoleophilia bacterium]